MSTVQDWSDFGRPKAYPLTTGLLLAATGLLVWTGLSAWGGLADPEAYRLREAWDTQAYFAVGLPVLAIAVAMASFYIPERIWRWPLWLVGGHQAGVLLVGIGMQSGLSLLLLAVILGVLLAAIFAVPALLGSLLARRVVARGY
jgi:hypothetical protein